MANSYLTHTTSAPTTMKNLTFSAWLKKGKEQEPIISRKCYIDGSNRFQFYNLDGSNRLQLYQQVSGSVEHEFRVILDNLRILVPGIILLLQLILHKLQLLIE